mmetsp:Transcript_11874/g.31241  ORF Transcript_11874/g.31241 Transcript_11874/m.31241 type:complete len:85 (+) Transcript_11874:271-525(+)
MLKYEQLQCCQTLGTQLPINHKSLIHHSAAFANQIKYKKLKSAASPQKRNWHVPLAAHSLIVWPFCTSNKITMPHDPEKLIIPF